MDLTELTECVKPDGNDILGEMFFQDIFGVSPSYELALPKTDRGVALEMLKHSKIFTEGQMVTGTLFSCHHFELKGLQYRLDINVYNSHQPCGYHVTMQQYGRVMKYSKFGDNLVQLIYEMLKSEW